MSIFTNEGSQKNIDIIEFFSKMSRQLLRGIRVSSKEELAKRIYKYFAEINETPVVCRGSTAWMKLTRRGSEGRPCYLNNAILSLLEA